MKKNNKYWKDYKKKYLKYWHFNPASKKKDYQFIGNLNTNYKNIDNLVNKLHLISSPEYAVNNNPKIKNKKILEKINSFKSWGYEQNNTKFYRAFSDDYKKIFEKFINFTGLDYGSSSIIKQFPGQLIPWHYDTHAEFYKKIISKKIKIKKNLVIRYMIFLKNWDWGHFFCIGSSVISNWKKGDIITWKPHIHHSGTNGGMTPKVTMNITGVISKKSIHLNHKIKNYKI